MKLLFIIAFIFILSCSTNKVKNNHGVLSLNNKFNKIVVEKSNSNDILNLLGPPSTKSSFDNNIWIYIERKKTNQSIFKLGKQKIEKNNVLVLELDNKGILAKKKLYNLDDMNDYKFVEKATQKDFSQNSFVYGVLSSLRDKINAPVRKRKEK
jgi:outer membrane protein assembly factor BamE (lipoprotein component of BamABCDE complex)|tara:strand:- start:1479 stop:1937 length:459 start_codon:yes stop_codon:yes gene_type:complete